LKATVAVLLKPELVETAKF